MGQVQGVFAGTDFWHLGVNAEPWSDKRLSPFIGIGLGKFKNIPNTSLVVRSPPTPSSPAPWPACAGT